MIYRFLRRLSVRQRVLGGFMIVTLLVALSLPFTWVNQNQLMDRLQLVTEVESAVNRQLLRASVRVASSRVNLLRFAQDLVPGPYEALDDVRQASQLLQETFPLVVEGSEQQRIQLLVNALGEYERLINDIQTARFNDLPSEEARLQRDALRLSNDISSQIELIVERSQVRVAEANASLLQDAQTRLVITISAFGLFAALALGLGFLVERSITVPVADLRAGAEAFSLGDLQTSIPVTGEDELSLLAQTFNRMATQLAQSYMELEQRVKDRTLDLEQRSAYLLAAAEVSRAAGAILDIDRLIEQSVQIILERFGLYYVGLFLVDEAGEWALLRAGTGEAGRAMLARHHHIRVGEGMIGWSIAHARARIALEAGADEVRKVTAELPETRSEAAIPLRSRGRVIGALTVQDDEPGAFDEAGVAVLQVMADQLAVAIDNARLYAESRERLQALQSAYGEVAREAWQRRARRGDLGYVTMVGDVVSETGGDWSADMRRAYQQGRLVQVDPLTLTIPLKMRETVVGVIQLRKPERSRPWTEQEIGLMMTLIEQLGVTLESARLYEETQQRAALERLVGEATGRIRETLDVGQVLQTAVRELRELLGLSSAEVYMGLEDVLPGQMGNGGAA